MESTINMCDSLLKRLWRDCFETFITMRAQSRVAVYESEKKISPTMQ